MELRNTRWIVICMASSFHLASDAVWVHEIDYDDCRAMWQFCREFNNGTWDHYEFYGAVLIIPLHTHHTSPFKNLLNSLSNDLNTVPKCNFLLFAWVIDQNLICWIYVIRNKQNKHSVITRINFSSRCPFYCGTTICGVNLNALTFAIYKFICVCYYYILFSQ